MLGHMIEEPSRRTLKNSEKSEDQKEHLYRRTKMKFLFAFLATLFLAAPAWAVDVQMGSGGNLIFEPSEVTIDAGDSIHFVNNMLPPHNVVVEDHPELSHEALAMLPGEEFDVTFPESGDYTYWCGPHKGAGMIGTVHVN